MKVAEVNMTHLVTERVEIKFFEHGQDFLKMRGFSEKLVIAGSYALWNYLHYCSGKNTSIEKNKFVPNDVDFYLFAEDPCVAYWMMASFRMNNPECEMLDISTKRSNGNYENVKQIVHIIDLSLKDPNLPCATKIQIVCWEPDEMIASTSDLAKNIIGTFDISVCRVAMIDPCNAQAFVFNSDEDKADIEEGVFSFKMKDVERTQSMMSRIMKYSSRGFSLKWIETTGGFLKGTFIITPK